MDGLGFGFGFGNGPHSNRKAISENSLMFSFSCEIDAKRIFSVACGERER